MNHDDHIQALQRTTADLTAKLTALTTDNADLKNKLTAVETQAKLLGDQKTTVIAPNTPAPVAPLPAENTVIQAPRGSSSGMKQILMMLLMSMMQSKAPQAAVSPYANPLTGSAFQQTNPLLGSSPSFGSSSMFNWNALSAGISPQAAQINAYGGYGASMYGATNPLRF